MRKTELLTDHREYTQQFQNTKIAKFVTNNLRITSLTSNQGNIERRQQRQLGLSSFEQQLTSVIWQCSTHKSSKK